jgi:hypothetical protein
MAMDAVVVTFSFPKSIVPPESVIVPLASVRLPKVDPVAAVIVPVVEMFSLPKLIAPDESVIEPSVKVRLPITESSPPASVPVVDKFSLPKLIDPDESVMDPFAKVKFPNVDPVMNVFTASKSNVPVAESVPSTMRFSLMFTDDESVALMVVPELNPMPSITTEPDPLADIFRSSLVFTASMLLSLNLMPGNTIDPVPLGCTSMSAFDCLDVMLLPKNLMSALTGARSKKSPKLLLILLPDSYS